MTQQYIWCLAGNRKEFSVSGSDTQFYFLKMCINDSLRTFEEVKLEMMKVMTFENVKKQFSESDSFD